MRGGHAGTGVVAGLLLAVACGNGDDAVRSELVEYAKGEWSCEIAMPEELGGTLDADVTVDATGDTRGEYAVELGVDDEELASFEGEWELDGTDLEVEDLDLATRYAIEGASLDTDGIEILEDGPDHDPVDVDVERNGDSVEFGWRDPWTDEPVTMDCTKG